MELTAQDKALLDMQFDAETEKIAAAQAAAIQEAYLYGLEKIAKDIADAHDEEEKKDDKEEKAEKMDEESEKAAAELGAFIERGLFDGLRKLGSERHGNELHYIEPYILDKIAADFGSKAVEIGKKALKAIDPRTAVDELRYGGKAVARGLSKDLREGTGGYTHLAGNDALRKQIAKKELKGGAAAIGTGLARLSPYAALGGGAIYGGSKLVGGKSNE